MQKGSDVEKYYNCGANEGISASSANANVAMLYL
jgi:hypothetical protein